MQKHRYRYQILRYIADLRRMEPQNVGIIVQSDAAITCRFNSRFRVGTEFDSTNYRAWREFFRAEILEKDAGIYQPKRTNIEFLEFLRSRCRGNYSLTAPLELVMESGAIKEVETYLFETLVKPPKEEVVKESQPVQLFQGELERRKLTNSPFLKRNGIFRIAPGIEELVEYQYERNHGADMPVLIQPVRQLPSIQATRGSIEAAENFVESIFESKVRAEVIVVVNEFRAMPSVDKETMRWLQKRLDKAKIYMSSRVKELVDDKPGAIALANGVEHDLKDLEEAAREPELSLADE